jgi:hypothetical protein
MEYIQPELWINPLRAKVKWKLYHDRLSVGQFVFVSGTYLKSNTRFLLLLESCGFGDVERPVWREDGCVVYNFSYATSVQSFSVPSSTGVMTIFYSLTFETPPTWTARFRINISLEQPGPIDSQAMGFVHSTFLITLFHTHTHHFK